MAHPYCEAPVFAERTARRAPCRPPPARCRAAFRARSGGRAETFSPFNGEGSFFGGASLLIKNPSTMSKRWSLPRPPPHFRSAPSVAATGRRPYAVAVKLRPRRSSCARHIVRELHHRGQASPPPPHTPPPPPPPPTPPPPPRQAQAWTGRRRCDACSRPLSQTSGGAAEVLPNVHRQSAVLVWQGAAGASRGDLAGLI